MLKTRKGAVKNGEPWVHRHAWSWESTLVSSLVNCDHSANPMQTLQRFLRSLNNAGVEYIVVGGHAVMFHGYPRATDDLDLLYHQSPANAERLASAVVPFVSRAQAADFMGPPDEFTVIRASGARIDLLPEISGITTAQAIETAIEAVLFGEPVKFISRELLLTNKRSTSRLKDLADVEELENLDERQS